MKHAFLIMAHDNYSLLRKLVTSLDHDNCDIYVHIDGASSDWTNSVLDGALQKGCLHFVDRVSISYLTYTHVQAVCSLMDAAVQSPHDYYHVLSGADLPIKNHARIDDFFSANAGCEFVGFANSFTYTHCHHKHVLLGYTRHRRKSVQRFFTSTRKALLLCQEILSYDALKDCPWHVKKGSDWYSLTHDAVRHLLEKEPIFRGYFGAAFCPSEYFAHTVLFNSRFRERIFSLDDEFVGCQRYIDWARGGPYVFRTEDFGRLKKSEMLFARKFVPSVDSRIIDMLCNYIRY